MSLSSGDQSKSYLQKILQIFQGPNWLKVAVQGSTAGITNTGTALDVNIASGVTLSASENLAQVNGVTVLTGAGATGTGAQRVTVSQDSNTVAGSSTLPAGENHIGSIGGNTTVISSTIVMSVAGAYATGDYMGTTTSPQSFAGAGRVSGGTGIIKSICISDKITTTNVAMELWIIDRTFTAPTDNAAWDLSDTNMLFVQAVIPIATTGWYASSAGQVYVDSTLAIPFKISTGTSLFYALVARGTTPVFTSSDLTISLGILQD